MIPTNTDGCVMIADECGLERYLDRLRRKNIRKVALDMEGDQGMFHYNHAVSILQCFDGESATIIDVLTMGVNDTLRGFLTNVGVVKVMFSCGNDVFMAQNVIGCTISPIHDIAIAQKLLDMPVNLTSYLNIDKEEKDSFQKANWLTRPIKPALLEYAVNDVLKLLDIENDLAEKLSIRGLYDDYVASASAISAKCYLANRHELFRTKFPGYARLPFEKKKSAAALWIFRELLGEKFDCPVGYLLSKKDLASIIGAGGDVAAETGKLLNRGRKPERRLNPAMIVELFEKAKTSTYIPQQKAAIKRRPINIETTAN